MDLFDLTVPTVWDLLKPFKNMIFYVWCTIKITQHIIVTKQRNRFNPEYLYKINIFQELQLQNTSKCNQCKIV